jgi:predicted small secreted protein
MMKRILAPLLAVLYFVGFVSFFGTLAGCNTVEGVGKDVERGGQAIKDEAREHKR